MLTDKPDKDGYTAIIPLSSLSAFPYIHVTLKTTIL